MNNKELILAHFNLGLFSVSEFERMFYFENNFKLNEVSLIKDRSLGCDRFSFI